MTKILNDKEYVQELVHKLREETDEFAAELSIEELADIQEVILALSDALNISSDDLEQARIKKVAKNGAFNKRIFLEVVK